jgi:hypothetical protein
MKGMEQESKQNLSFEDFIRGEIAKLHGISPEEVTMEFIMAEREKLYRNPNHKFTDTREGLVSQNYSEIEAERKAAEEFLNKILK